MRLSSFGPWLRRSRCDLCGRALGAHEWAELDAQGFVVVCSVIDKNAIEDFLSEILSQSPSATPNQGGD